MNDSLFVQRTEPRERTFLAIADVGTMIGCGGALECRGDELQVGSARHPQLPAGD